MKRVLALFLVLICMLSVVACDKATGSGEPVRDGDVSDISEIDKNVSSETEQTQQANVESISGTISHIDEDKICDLTEEEVKIIADIIGNGTWNTEGTADCANDCKLIIDERTYYYHSECGTFNDEKNNQNLLVTAEEKEKFENKKIKDKEFADNSRYIIKILMFILMIVCPPLLVIFIIFMLVVKSSSKIKWLIHNWKSGVMNVMYYIALAMAEATPIVAAYYFNIQISIITVLVLAILISVITYAIIRATHKSQFYLAMRNIAMYPIVILLTLLPFALTGAMAYIGYTAKTAVNNVNGGGNPYGGTGPDFVYDNPHVYQVSGYSYYNSHGTFVVVGPSMRTMPDASVYNNLSYKG